MGSSSMGSSSTSSSSTGDEAASSSSFASTSSSTADGEAVCAICDAGFQLRRTRAKPATVIPISASAAAVGRTQRCCQSGVASASSESTAWSDSAGSVGSPRDASPAVAQAKVMSSDPICRDALRSRRSTKPCTSRSANQASRSATEASTSRYPGKTSRSSQARQYSHCAANRSPG